MSSLETRVMCILQPERQTRADSLASFILTHCILTYDQPLIAVSSFFLWCCAVTSNICSKKNAVWMSFYKLLFCLILTEAAAFFLRSRLTLWPLPAGRPGTALPQGCCRWLWETSGQTNEPQKASIVYPMALLESQDGGSFRGTKRLSHGCRGGWDGCETYREDQAALEGRTEFLVIKITVTQG